MLVNFITLRDKRLTLVERNQRNIEEEHFSNCNYTLFCLSFMTLLLYFLFNVATVFFDFIFGVVYIKSWLIVNGILGYIGLILLVMMTRIYTEDTFLRKTLKMSAYFINGFLVVWTVIGMTSFFRDYYGIDTSHKVLYNYLLIRMILAPIISLYKLGEICFI